MTNLNIAITGPESTGKSTLASRLADFYNVPVVPEVARFYIENLDRAYNFSDLLEIAKTQKNRYDELNAKNYTKTISDTSLLTIEIWSMDKFGKCDPWILSNVQKESFDLYLLCNTDTPWTFDEQREDQHRRDELLELYKDYLIKYNFKYKIISGLGEERLQNAIKAIELFESESQKSR